MPTSERPGGRNKRRQRKHSAVGVEPSPTEQNQLEREAAGFIVESDQQSESTEFLSTEHSVHRAIDGLNFNDGHWKKAFIFDREGNQVENLTMFVEQRRESDEFGEFFKALDLKSHPIWNEITLRHPGAELFVLYVPTESIYEMSETGFTAYGEALITVPAKRRNGAKDRAPRTIDLVISGHAAAAITVDDIRLV